MSIAAAYYRELTYRELERRFQPQPDGKVRCSCGAVFPTMTTHQCLPANPPVVQHEILEADDRLLRSTLK